jgi:hypothetical protein
MTDQAQVRQSHDSEDGFIPIDSLLEEVRGNDGNALVTNDTTLQAAFDTDTRDQAVLRQTTNLSEEKACEVAADSTTTSTDQIVTEENLNLSENEMNEDASGIIVVCGKLACHFNR